MKRTYLLFGSFICACVLVVSLVLIGTSLNLREQVRREQYIIAIEQENEQYFVRIWTLQNQTKVTLFQSNNASEAFNWALNENPIRQNFLAFQDYFDLGAQLLIFSGGFLASFIYVLYKTRMDR